MNVNGKIDSGKPAGIEKYTYTGEPTVNGIFGVVVGTAVC